MTSEEVVRLVEAICNREVLPSEVDWEGMPEVTKNLVFILVAYVIESRIRKKDKAKKNKAQRRAFSLLRTLLTPGQIAELKRTRHFTVVGSSGGLYRLMPSCHHVSRIEKHGKNHYSVVSFCLHDVDRELPPADVCIGHLMWLRSDEQAFLKMANHRNNLDMMWNGDYLRTLNAARKRRATETALPVTQSGPQS